MKGTRYWFICIGKCTEPKNGSSQQQQCKSMIITEKNKFFFGIESMNRSSHSISSGQMLHDTGFNWIGIRSVHIISLLIFLSVSSLILKSFVSADNRCACQ